MFPLNRYTAKLHRLIQVRRHSHEYPSAITRGRGGRYSKTFLCAPHKSIHSHRMCRLSPMPCSLCHRRVCYLLLFFGFLPINLLNWCNYTGMISICQDPKVISVENFNNYQGKLIKSNPPAVNCHLSGGHTDRENGENKDQNHGAGIIAHPVFFVYDICENHFNPEQN